MNKLAILLLVLFVSACQTSMHTDTEEKHQGEIASLVEANKQKISITDKTVVIDARKYYQYNMNHVPGSIQMGWSDLLGSRKVRKNSIKQKSKKLIKRLALKGIHPSKEVVVLGAGDRGKGEAASLSWILYSLGIKKIKYANIYELNAKLTTKRPKSRENEKPWKFKIRKALALSKTDLTKYRNLFVIDVRGKKEYMVKSLATIINLELGTVINIPYKEFFTYQGRPDSDISSKLKSIGVGKDDHVVLVSNKGKRATAAAMSLMSLGWSKTHVLFL